MTAALVIAGIAVMVAAFSIAYYKRDIIELFVLGLTGFFCAYVLCSGLLFWINKFEINAALKFTLAAGLVFLAVTAFFIRRRPSCTFSYKDTMIPLAAFAIAFIVVCPKFGYFGMGQDQGVYQVKALMLINGENNNFYTFDEYDRLEESIDIESYEYEAVNSLVGFYGYDSRIPALHKEDFPNRMTGVLHGVPTYAAMLALYGSLFGYAKMTDLQTLLLFLGMFLMYYVMRNLKINKKLRFAGLLIYASSPIVLWTSKTTLTEIFTLVLVMLYLYLMTDRKYERYICMSFMPLVVFSFFHVTIYTILPMIVIIYFTLYYMTRNKQYMLANLLTLMGYTAGFYMMCECAAVYTYGNYKKIYVMGINDKNLVPVVTAAAAVCIAAALAILIVPMDRQERFREIVTYVIRKHMRLVVRILLALSITALVVMFILTKTRLNYSTFYAYIISSGIVPIFFLFAAFLYRPQFITAHKDHLLLTIMFVYMVIMYSCILKPDIGYYYYYARYIVPYIPIIIILTMLRISRIDPKAGAKRFVIPITVSVVYAVLMFPTNIALTAQKDISNMDWKTVRDLSTGFDSNDAVIIDSTFAPTLKFTIKLMTKADVYPDSGDMLEQLKRLEQNHENVYYITNKDWFLFKNYTVENVYSAVNRKWYDETESIDGRQQGGINPFPNKFTNIIQHVNVYRCDSVIEQ